MTKKGKSGSISGARKVRASGGSRGSKKTGSKKTGSKKTGIAPLKDARTAAYKASMPQQQSGWPRGPYGIPSPIDPLWRFLSPPTSPSPQPGRPAQNPGTPFTPRKPGQSVEEIRDERRRKKKKPPRTPRKKK